MWKEQLGSLLEVFSAEAKAASCLSHTVLELSLLEGEAGRGGSCGCVMSGPTCGKPGGVVHGLARPIAAPSPF